MCMSDEQIQETLTQPAETGEESIEEIPKKTAPLSYTEKISGADDVKPGMTVRIHERIKDISPKGEERERIQIFEGIILGVQGADISKTITVRRVSKGFGVEKIYPLYSPSVSQIEVVKLAKVRRAKLTFLRDLKQTFKRKLKETRVK